MNFNDYEIKSVLNNTPLFNMNIFFTVLVKLNDKWFGRNSSDYWCWHLYFSVRITTKIRRFSISLIYFLRTLSQLIPLNHGCALISAPSPLNPNLFKGFLHIS